MLENKLYFPMNITKFMNFYKFKKWNFKIRKIREF